MALVTHAYSNWRISEVGTSEEPELNVQFHGSFLLKDLEDIDGIVSKIQETEQCKKYQLIALKLYLKYWKQYQKKEIDFNTYINRLECLRKIQMMDAYLYNSFLPYPWRHGYMPYKEKVYIIEYSQRYSRNKLIERKCKVEYVPYGLNEVYIVKIIDKETAEFRNKDMLLETVKFPKRMRKLYPEEPILVGENYYFNFMDWTIFNSPKEGNPQYYKEKTDIICEQISKLSEMKENMIKKTS